LVIRESIVSASIVECAMPQLFIAALNSCKNGPHAVQNAKKQPLERIRPYTRGLNHRHEHMQCRGNNFEVKIAERIVDRIIIKIVSRIVCEVVPFLRPWRFDNI